MAKFFNDPKFSDVLIKCETEGETETEFFCHRNVLGAVSPVFEAMFDHEQTLENKTNVVKIPDFDKEAVEIFLQLAYRVNSDKFDSLTFDGARSAIMICDKYILDPDLKNNLGDGIIKSGLLKDWDSAQTFGIMAHKFNFQTLDRAANEKLVEIYWYYPNKDTKPLQECPDFMHDFFIGVIYKNLANNTCTFCRYTLDLTKCISCRKLFPRQ